ncbi:beta-amyrin 28-monooxygenase-like [Quercus lobata]|uniref:beta-amyrin 28-monooxygenase-like n=1 Tax=Quercus lobata TaxID=97700 RepID=UPI00124796A0|nr:beta-amyrin 28-monooxygenase-like [Quercus lobata]
MDFFPNLLHLVILCISVSLIFLIYKQKSNHAKLPPGKMGWPVIGETLEFAMARRRGAQEIFFNERMRKYSQDLFKTSLFGENMVVFCGASANKSLFHNDKKNLSTWWPRSMQKIVSSPELVEDVAQKDFVQMRRAVVEFLKPEALQHFVPIMDSMAKEHLETEWSPYREVKVFPLSKKYAFALACRFFLSVTNHNHVTKFADHFAIIIRGLLSVPINIPGTTFNRAIRAGKVVRQEILEVIKQRKKELSENDGTVARDFLTHSLLELDENGKAINEMMIASRIMSLLIAGHDTTNSAITFVLKYLAEFPHVYSEVFKEQMEIAISKGPNDLLNWDDIKKMKYSWNVVLESMRLTPPTQGTFREVVNDFTYTNFTIPKGWKTFWTPYSTHKNPKYFQDPEKFNPSRFEGNGPEPYTFVPFGGGPRMCPGREYARLEILVFMHNVVTRFKWEKAILDEKLSFYVSPIPVNGLPIYLKPHSHK